MINWPFYESLDAVRACTVEAAAVLMREHHVGTLVVTDDAPNDNRALGIVTDRDFVVQAAAAGIGPKEATLGEVMTHGLAAIAATADIHEAMEAMRAKGIRRLAVTRGDGMLVGIVSFDDVIDALAAELTSLAGIIRSEREREVVQRPEGLLVI
ncbi:MAG TPA: CBS domain-containing protein [Burkholderiales bacterium]|nr:CBS domain-containing protein [Burkholderiales bacterium]